jgi:predicted metalloprotease with PDZ domain
MRTIRSLIIRISCLSFLWLIMPACTNTNTNSKVEQHSDRPVLQFTVSMQDAVNHKYHVELSCSGWNSDTIVLRMPCWMPGYYKLMNYSGEVNNLQVMSEKNDSKQIERPDKNSWKMIIQGGKPFRIDYDIKADRRFVANSFIDTTHAYIIPEATFMYINDMIDIPVTVKIESPEKWDKIVTGLAPVDGEKNVFNAPDFDVLYDCPLLAGQLEELPSFRIYGVEHRFVGYKIGDFDRTIFMEDLEKAVKTGIDIIGDIPYKQYTFIAIGRGRGGIEHSNSSTVSFDGTSLDGREAMRRTLSFITHEYFHLYNVKRIRPFELGPFNYEGENRTNLLWVSEGLTVYYEYIILKRAGLSDEKEFFSDFESNININENNPGRLYQSLVQASYKTWDEGPFGNQGTDPGKSISYYDKGPCVGLILDLSIRHATQNRKSLDDVFRFLYEEYYKKLRRGFTDAEFQQACENIAGITLNDEFEYVYTTREIDYNKYLAYAGLKLTMKTDKNTARKNFTISRLENMNEEQAAVLKGWQGE